MSVLIRRYKGHNGMMQEERIDDDDPVALVEECPRDQGTDVPGAPDDEDRAVTIRIVATDGIEAMGKRRQRGKVAQRNVTSAARR